MPSALNAKENWFPFERVTGVRVGSTHDQGDFGQLPLLVSLVRLVSEHVNAPFSPVAAGEPVWVEVKGGTRPADPEGGAPPWGWYDPHTARPRFEGGLSAPLLPGAVPLAPANGPLWKPSPAQRIIGRDLFLCVFVRGFAPNGGQQYCYFGAHFDQIAEVLRCAREARPFNPASLSAAVLARHAGDPPPEVRRFLNERFSFEEAGIRLEIDVGRR